MRGEGELLGRGGGVLTEGGGVVGTGGGGDGDGMARLLVEEGGDV